MTQASSAPLHYQGQGTRTLEMSPAVTAQNPPPIAQYDSLCLSVNNAEGIYDHVILVLVALRFADYGYVLENGRVVMDGAAGPRGKRRREGVLSRALDCRPQELPR
jgi:hypothetical protein